MRHSNVRRIIARPERPIDMRYHQHRGRECTQWTIVVFLSIFREFFSREDDFKRIIIGEKERNKENTQQYKEYKYT